MKYNHYILLLLFILFFSCSKEKELSFDVKDSFIMNLENQSLARIDSILVNDSSISDTKKALLYYYKARKEGEEQKHKKAIENFDKSLVLFKKFKVKKYIGETYWQLGSHNIYISNVEEGVDQVLKALEYSKELHNKKLEANVYASLSHAHYIYQDFDKSINYIQKAIVLQKEEKDSIGLSATYNNLAIIYKNMGDYTNALDYNIKSFNLNLKNKDSSAVAKSYNNLGLVSERLGDSIVARKYFVKALELNTKISRLNSSPVRNLGAYFLRKNNYGKAKKYYLHALYIEQETENTQILKEIYNALLHIALQENDTNNALLYQEQHDFLTISNAKVEMNKKLELMDGQYKLAISKRALKQEQSINDKNKIIFGISVGLLLLIGLFWLQRVKNKQLKTGKDKIRLEQKVLRSQMNPHFIFNALSAIQNSLLDNEPIKSASYLSRFAKLIRQNFDFINEQKIFLADEIDALQNYMDTQQLRYNDKFDYEINIHAGIDINKVEIPPLLLQPFVENAIEHGFKNLDKKGFLSITFSKQNSSICYDIKDNGKGFDLAYKDGKIHAIDIFKKRLKLIGNNDEKSFKINSSKEGTRIKFCLKND